MEGKDYVEYLLKNYHQLKREIEVKKVLLEINLSASEEEIIEEMNYKAFKGEKVKHSTIADKTANIAMKYREESELNIKELKGEIRKRELELLKLETALGVLDKKLQTVIKGIYFQGKSRRQLCRELYVSEGTLGRWRKKAVEEVRRLV